jgi:E3 ubiquitin-protein ligase RNF5
VCGSSAAKKYGSCDWNYSFECNICLDMAKQPMVSHCMHLSCWPCLHQWLHAPSPFSECPVCKGEVLEANVTPIYGTGGEEGYSTANPDLPPQVASKQKGQPEPTAANGRHKRNCNSGEDLIQNQGVVRGLPIPAL